MDAVLAMLLLAVFAGVPSGFLTTRLAKKTGWATWFVGWTILPTLCFVGGTFWVHTFVFGGSQLEDWAFAALLGIPAGLFIYLPASFVAIFVQRRSGYAAVDENRKWNEIASEVEREDAARAHQEKFEELVRMTENNKAKMKEWRTQHRDGRQ